MKVILLGPFNDCLIWTPTESSTAPDQAVGTVNVGEQVPGSISEAMSHADATTIQQHVVGDVMSSARENGKKSRKRRISESIILNDGSCSSTTLLFSLDRIKIFRAPCHYSFKKCSQCTCILHFKVRPGELFSFPQKLIAQ